MSPRKLPVVLANTRLISCKTDPTIPIAIKNQRCILTANGALNSKVGASRQFFWGFEKG